MKSKSGFTIVELAVVIAVIAILALVSVVSYNGIQTRARNTQLLSAFDMYEKALRQYKTFNGSYPLPTEWALGEAYACLGDFKGKAPLRDDMCFLSEGTELGRKSASINTALKTIVDATPTVDYQVTFTNTTAVGGIIYLPLGNGAVILAYYIKDNQECGRGTKTNTTEFGINYTSCAIMLS